MTAPGKPLDLDGMKPVAWRYSYRGDGRPVRWTLTQKPTTSSPQADGWCEVVAEPLYAEADVLALIQTQRELVGALSDARFFIQDSLTNGHLSGGDVGNLMGARDVIDRALTAAKALGEQPL